MTSGQQHTRVTHDPVCGMQVDADNLKHVVQHDDVSYGFCCAGCAKKFEADPDQYTTATDPVCAMTVARAAPAATASHGGQRYYFCSSRCHDKFVAEPETFLGDQPAPEPMPEGTLYTCPMDPEIVQEGPGTCSICGMALEPMGVPPLDAGPNPERVDFTRRVKV